MIRRIALRAWVLCWLTMVWILLWGTLSWANLVGGLAVAAVITWLLPLPVVPVQGRLHVLSLVRLVAQVSWYLVESSLQVAWLAIKPGPQPRSAVLQTTLSVKSDLVLALAVQILNLIPGTIVVEVNQDRRLLLVHVLDVGSPRAVDKFHDQTARVQRLLVATFERDTDWRPTAEEPA